MIDWSCTWEFEDLHILVQDKPAGRFSGEAELAEDWHGEFYVASIVLDDGNAVLNSTGRSTMGFLDPGEAWLFARLADTIIKSDDAQRFWAEQMREQEMA